MSESIKSRLAALFTEWKDKHKDKGYKNFIKDGIVNYDAWESQKTPKVCYLLKEAYWDSDFSLTDELAVRLWGIWEHKIPFWTQGVYDALIDPEPFEPMMDENTKREIINQIAVVNLKKSNGSPHSESDDLMQYVHADKELLRRELTIIEPDVIICGYTFHLARNVLEGMEVFPTGDGKWRNSLVIDYYHPSNWHGAAGNTEIHYYALREICRSELKRVKGDVSPSWSQKKEVQK